MALIPAMPGLMAVIMEVFPSDHPEDEDQQVCVWRLPIVAWEIETNGDDENAQPIVPGRWPKYNTRIFVEVDGRFFEPTDNEWRDTLEDAKATALAAVRRLEAANPPERGRGGA
jgi:hypothetical protein